MHGVCTQAQKQSTRMRNSNAMHTKHNGWWSTAVNASLKTMFLALLMVLRNKLCPFSIIRLNNEHNLCRDGRRRASKFKLTVRVRRWRRSAHVREWEWKRDKAKNEKTTNNCTPFNTTNKSFVKTHSNNFRTENNTSMCMRCTTWKKMATKVVEVATLEQQTFSFSEEKDRHDEHTGNEAKSSQAKPRPVTSKLWYGKNWKKRSQWARELNAFSFKRENFNDLAIVSTSGFSFCHSLRTSASKSNHKRKQVATHSAPKHMKINKHRHCRYRTSEWERASEVRKRDESRAWIGRTEMKKEWNELTHCECRRATKCYKA